MTTATLAAPVLTVPVLALRIGVPLDRLRRVLQRRPDLAALLTMAGPTRVLPSDRVEEFAAALAAKPVTTAG